jgi:hypothetical protein
MVLTISSAKNGLTCADWIWLPECPVIPDPASVFSSLNLVFTTAALEGPTGEIGEVRFASEYSLLPKLPPL